MACLGKLSHPLAEVVQKLSGSVSDWLDNTNEVKLETAKKINHIPDEMKSTADMIHQARQKSSDN